MTVLCAMWAEEATLARSLFFFLIGLGPGLGQQALGAQTII